MNETYQNRITDQICKIQNDRALIAFYDRLRYAPLGNYAQLHAKGEYQENGHKVHSLICITIQDYSNGTGDRNIITRFNLAPEQIQFLLTRITSGFQEFEWSQSKIYGNPDQNGYSTAQMFYISRHPYDSKGQPMKSPWKIQIVNGKGIKAQNKNGGSYMQPRSFQSEKTTAIQLTDMDLFTLLKRTDSYISNWETVIAASLINNGKRMLQQYLPSQLHPCSDGAGGDVCLTRMEELESCLSGLLSTLKKNREHVPLEVLKTQYKQPYEELVRNINLTASAYAKSVLLHRLVLNPDADVEEQCTVINQMIQTSGMLKKISSCMSKTYDVGQIYPLILELRHMVEQALWPYVNQATCLVADLDDIEKEPTIYNFLTHEVYENDTWIHREIDLRWKLLVHLTPEQRESVPPANHSMNGGIYHERTTI